MLYVLHRFAQIHRWAEWDQLLCIEELKLAILAKSCLCPGFSTLISNLVESSSEYDVAVMGDDCKCRLPSAGYFLHTPPRPAWSQAELTFLTVR